MADIIDTTLAKKTLKDLVVTKEVGDVSEPTLTETTVNAVITHLLGGVIRGYTDIANEIGFEKVSRSQVKEIHTKMKAKIAELTSEEVVEEVKK